LRGFSKDQYRKLVHRYGSNIDRIFEIATTYDPSNKFGLTLDLYVQIVYSLEEEMTVKPVDFFIRRTGALLFNIEWVFEWKEAIIDFMEEALGWTLEEKTRFTEELETALQEAKHPIPMN
ncbi:MAG: glycerol-3-phosphate dehydrogenase C-terminal domain-containing protein, partial [Bacillus sp. (in: firmicutes)]